MYPSCPLTFIRRSYMRSVSVLPFKGGTQGISMQQKPRNTPQTSGQGQNSFGGTIPLPLLPGSTQGIHHLPVVTAK